MKVVHALLPSSGPTTVETPKTPPQKKRQLGVATLNGQLWAAVAGLSALWSNEDAKLGIIFGSAMIINLITAALAGAFLPLILKAMKIDPALAGGVVLTTITDVVGFLSFLGLATLFY